MVKNHFKNCSSRIRIRIFTKIYSVRPCHTPNLSTKFHPNSSKTCWDILHTNKQTNKQKGVKTWPPSPSVVEVIKYRVVQYTVALSPAMHCVKLSPWGRGCNALLGGMLGSWYAKHCGLGWLVTSLASKRRECGKLLDVQWKLNFQQIQTVIVWNMWKLIFMSKMLQY